MPSPRAVPVTLRAAERTTLKKRARGATTPYRDRLRAQIVLAAARGRDNARIAADLRVTADTVRKWRGRFAARGLAGLTDLPRSGRPRRISELTRAAVVALACQLPAGTSRKTAARYPSRYGPSGSPRTPTCSTSSSRLRNSRSWTRSTPVCAAAPNPTRSLWRTSPGPSPKPDDPRRDPVGQERGRAGCDLSATTRQCKVRADRPFQRVASGNPGSSSPVGRGLLPRHAGASRPK